MNRKRILHISTRLILGGSQENTVLSCEGQARLGHDVHLAFGPIYGPEGSMLERANAFRTDEGQQITTHEAPSLVREISPLKDRRALREIQELIRDIQPDVVHTHSSKAGILGRRAGWKCRDTTTVIHTIHGPPFMPLEGGLLSRTRIRIKNHLYTIAERSAAKHCHKIISVADAMTKTFLERRIGKPEQYVTVRSGMELDPFLNPAPNETRDAIRNELGFAENDFVAGTVARIAQHKGHDDLLDALSKDMQRDPRLKLLWVGDGWWKDRIDKRIAELGLDEQVIRTGLVPPHRVPAMIRAMDALAHPSSREGLPRTVPQALLSKVCPIAYDVDGTPELCRDMQTGRLVPHADTDALRDAILWARDNPSERKQLAEAGYEETRREFDADRMIERLEEVYDDAR